MEKCKKCKNKIGLVYCYSCSSFYCFECDRIIHSLPDNKTHKRKNKTFSILNSDDIKQFLIRNKTFNINKKYSKTNGSFKAYITQNNFHKIKNKEDPDINLINKLALNLDNDLNQNLNKENDKENYNVIYKNDFNKIYRLLKISNYQNNIDVNNLLNIIEQQDIIINDLFKKIIFLKQQIKEISVNIKDENYFDKKLDIINKMYEKEREILIKEQEDKILKIKKEYNKIKDKYLNVIKERKNKFKGNVEIDNIIKKLRLDKSNINKNNNRLNKINDDLNIVEFCMNSHIDELINKLIDIKLNQKENENSNKEQNFSNQKNDKNRFKSYSNPKKKI